MKNKTKLFVVALFLFVFCFSLTGGVFAAQSFPDVSKSHWANDLIKEATEKGYLKGYPDGTFRPDEPITRAELTAIFSRVLVLQEKTGKEFSDVKDGWYTAYVNSAAFAGIIDGYPDGSFKPDKNISREESAKILAASVPDNATETIGLDRFIDKTSIGTWAKDAVKLVSNKGYFLGDDHKRFLPQTNLTRAEAAAILVRMAKAETIVSDTALAASADAAAVAEAPVYSSKIYSNGIADLRNASISDSVLLGASTLSGTVTLNNVRGTSFSSGGTLYLTADRIVVGSFVINNPTTIVGTGTINALTRNVPEENFTSEIVIDPKNVTENPSKGYAIQITTEYSGDTKVLNLSYGKDDTIYSAVENFIDDPVNADKIDENLIQPLNANIDSIQALQVNGKPLYSEEGWTAAIGLFDGTDVNDTALAAMKPDFNNEVTIEEVQNFLGGFNTLYSAELSADQRSTLLSNLDGFTLTTDPVVFTYADGNKVSLSDNKAIGQYLVKTVLWTGDSVDAFFGKVGTKASLEAKNGAKTITVTVEQVPITK